METNLPSHKPLFSEASFDLIVMGASAGGIPTLQTILAALPPDFPAAIAIVQHRSSHYHSYLCEILQRKTALSVQETVTGDTLKAGTVYLAPAGKQLLVNSAGILSLSSVPLSRYCPSVDVLFNAAAHSFNKRCLGVVLTGMLADGAEGAQTIAAAGGRVLVQNQATSFCFSMPHAAIKTGRVNFVLPIENIAPALVTMVMVKGAADFFNGSMPYWD